MKLIFRINKLCFFPNHFAGVALVLCLSVGFVLRSQPGRAQIITTIAGSDSKGDGGPATDANLIPYGVAVDGRGNIYTTDVLTNTIRKIAPDGTISLFAGNGTSGFSGDGGLAINASLTISFGAVGIGIGVMTADSYGNIFLTAPGGRIRRIDVNGIITTIVGTGIEGAGGDGGPARSAQLNAPSGLTVDANGNLYIAESGNRKIRKVDVNGIITTVASLSPNYGFGGDGGPSVKASVRGLESIAVDAVGNLYFADTNNSRIRKIDTDGLITTIAGTGTEGAGGDGGPATSAQLNRPSGVLVDKNGNIYIDDNFSYRIRKIDTKGIITTVAGGTQGFGGDGGPATSASIQSTLSFAIDDSGNIFLPDYNNRRIRRVDTNGIITTIAGNGGTSFRGDDGPATNAVFNSPAAVTLDRTGNIYVADKTNNRVRKIDTKGIVTTIAGNGIEYPYGTGDGGPALSAAVYKPTDIAVDSLGNVYIATGLLIRRITPAGLISTIAGNNAGVGSITGEGVPATGAGIATPTGLAIDNKGVIYIAHFGMVRKVDANGIITTVAGDGIGGFSGDGGPAIRAKILPDKLTVDDRGNLFIATTSPRLVRKVDANGIITTVAGNPARTGSFAGDGGPATEAALGTINGLAIDTKGNLFIAGANNRIRVVDAQGIITTIAGNGMAAFTGDGGPTSKATLSNPGGLTVDKNGVIYVADTGNNRVRRFNFSPPPTIVGSGITSPQSATLGIPFSTSTAYAFADPKRGSLTYSSSSLPTGLSINASTGLISGTLTYPTNTTFTSAYGITVGATDSSGVTIYSGFYLNVYLNPAINEAPRVVGRGIISPQSGRTGISFTTPTAYAFLDPEGRPLVYTASGLPPGLNINASTGLISGTPTAGGSTSITVRATDDGGLTAFSSFQLTINAAPIVIGSGLNSPLSATLGVGVSIPTAYAFADPEGRALLYSSASIPAGLSLNVNTGVISGIPTKADTYGITIGAIDDGGSTVYSGFYLIVQPNPALPVVVGHGITSPQSATVGVPFSTSTAYAFSDPQGRALRYSSSSLPNGLSINASTGVISGVPIKADTYGITVGATNDLNLTIYSGFYLTVVTPGGGRIEVSPEAGSALQIRVLGNPTRSEQVGVEIRGVAGEEVWLRSFDSHGRLLSTSLIKQAGEVEQAQVRLGQSAGLYYVQVGVPGQQQMVKVLKQ